MFEQMSASLSRENVVSFVKINNDNQTDIVKEYAVTSLPTFLFFRDGEVIEKVQGVDIAKLHAVLGRLDTEVKNLGLDGGNVSGSGIATAGPWNGAEIPRGYSDITNQIEVRNCELLNADDEAGPVKVLFENTRPSALDGKGKASSTKDWVQSGADDQLLLYIPFQSVVKLHTLQVNHLYPYHLICTNGIQLTSLPSTDDDDAPARPGTIHLYINRPQSMDFSEADDTEPTQVIELTDADWNSDGTTNVGLRFVKFQKTNSVIIYVQKGDGEAETVRLDRVKLIGESGPKREMGALQKVGDDE